MRQIRLAFLTLLLGGCALDEVRFGPPSTRSQSELDRRAREACSSTPNTDDHQTCRRETQDSWQGDNPVQRKPE
jgi:hypothetical protein